MGQPKNTVTYYTEKSVTSYKTTSNQSLPSSIKCARCSIVKNPEAFAKNRLDDLKNEIAKKGNGYNAAKQAYIACMQCTGKQVTELFCISCDKWKGLNSFSKAQRRNPDKAKCWPCMEEQLNTEPGASSNDDNSDADSDSDSDGSQGGTTLGGTLANLSITNETSSAGGVAVASPTPSKISTATPPHLRKPASSAVSVNSGNSKFPKVRPEPRKVYMDAAQRERDREERELDDDVEVASSDSDSD